MVPVAASSPLAVHVLDVLGFVHVLTVAIDLCVAPVSAALVLLALALRRGHHESLRALATLNLILGGIGLGGPNPDPFGYQTGLALALLAILAAPRAATAVFGDPPAPPPPA